ncbi:MAG: FtsQ-type POTRA domain-containing protein [Oscillospiraceae bacterium]|nr:FtsQ-type POTRA domain-containing protein [Oscillospiraceae bacterium]
MATRRNRKRRRKTRRRSSALYKLLSIVLICVVLLIGSFVFFRVDTVQVEGNERYAAEEIIAASGVEQGDNLFGLNKLQIERDISAKLPYVGAVSVTRRLPATLRITIQESTAVAVVQSGEEWWLINSSCKLLERGDATLAEGRAQVYTLELLAPSVGTKMVVVEEQRSKYTQMAALLLALNEQGIATQVTDFIDVTADNEIRFGYRGELTVVVPMNADFDVKVLELCHTVESLEEQNIDLTGTLELTYGDGKAHLLPTRWLPDTGAADAPQEEEEVPASEAPATETEPAEEAG